MAKGAADIWQGLYSVKVTRLPSRSKIAVEKSWAAKYIGDLEVRSMVIPISSEKFFTAEYIISKSAGWDLNLKVSVLSLIPPYNKSSVKPVVNRLVGGMYLDAIANCINFQFRYFGKLIP
jgi:hypothetical protein